MIFRSREGPVMAGNDRSKKTSRKTDPKYSATPLSAQLSLKRHQLRYLSKTQAFLNDRFRMQRMPAVAELLQLAVKLRNNLHKPERGRISPPHYGSRRTG